MAIWVHLVKYENIPSSKAPKSHLKLITYTNNENGLDILIGAVFATSPQLWGLGPKYQDLVIYFCLVGLETLPQFHLRDLQIRS